MLYAAAWAERNFLRRARALEALHLALPPSGRLMRILRSIVLPSSTLMQVLESYEGNWVTV